MIPQLTAYIAAHPVIELALWALLAIAFGNIFRRSMPWLASAMRLVGHLALIVALLLAAAHVLVHLPLDGGPLAEDQPQQTMTGSETRVRLAPDGHFWVQARANGTAWRLLVDTGATLTTLSAAAANGMGAIADPDGGQLTLTTANGTTQAQLGIIPSLRVGNVVVRHLPIAVAPAMAATNVLGMNFLSQLASWRVEGHTLILVPHHPQAPRETASPS